LKSLNFDNRFIRDLPADPIKENSRRQVHKACYSFVEPTKVSAPSLLSFSNDAANLLDLDSDDCKSDGRAINLGEIKNKSGDYWALQLKGAGPTPYSRTADGLAVLRSSIREYLCSEAMYYLGVPTIPTTRALSLINTGEQVMRDILYDGNAAYEPGTVVCRLSPSFVRFGSFQIFSARNEHDQLKQLADVTIKHHFSHLLEQFKEGSAELYLAWFNEVCQRTVSMIVDWMRVGFVHGVMNTDNMSILGLTIDYGPYGWLDDFNPEWTPNTTDSQHRRYRYEQQANVALWNCYQLANALYPLIEQTEPLEAILNEFQSSYQDQWLTMMASKLGLENVEEGDQDLFERLETLLAQTETDMTLFYRLLATDELSVNTFENAYYQAPESDYIEAMTNWLSDYSVRRERDDIDNQTRFDNMNAVNPLYVFRNYLAQQAIDKAEQGDMSMIDELLEVLKNPYTEQSDKQHLAAKRPDWARTKVGCSMLSCSS